MKRSGSSTLALTFLVLVLAGCVSSSASTMEQPPTLTASASPVPPATPTPSPIPPTPTSISVIHLRSMAFSVGSDLPAKYTCDGKDVSPSLYWDGPPAGTLSFALILDNPDATTGRGWVHWILFNIPAESLGLLEAVPAIPELDDDSRHGRNSESWMRYTGPCPPFTQRYFFALYALDLLLELEVGASKEELMQAIQGHILAQGELMGRYKRQ